MLTVKTKNLKITYKFEADKSQLDLIHEFLKKHFLKNQKQILETLNKKDETKKENEK